MARNKVSGLLPSSSS